jgi:hypothetical protein
VAQVEGTAVQSSLRYVQEGFGDDPLAGVLAALPEADRNALGQGVLASSWYPMGTFLRSAHSTCVHRGDSACRFEGSRD